MLSKHVDPLGGKNDRNDEGPIEPLEEQFFEPIDLMREDTRNMEDPNKYNIMGGEEKGGANGLPQAVNLWHPAMGDVRSHVLKLWLRTVMVLFVFIFLVLSLFYAVFYHIPQNFSSLIVYVVDFDGQVAPYHGGTPLVGPSVVQKTEHIAKSGQPHLGYRTMPPSTFNFDPRAVRQAVYDFKAHAAIIVNSNATALLRQAVGQGNSTYDPNGAAQIVYVSARDQATIPTYVVPQLAAFEKDMIAHFGSMWARMVVTNPSLQSDNLAAAPQALSPAIGFTTLDLRPFDPATVTPAISVGLIYLIIIAFFSIPFFLPIHMKYLSPRGHPPLRFWQLIVWRWCATMTTYFLLSLSYSLVLLAFRIPVSSPSASSTEPALNANAYGHATFVVYWMLNFVGMAALGLACENVAMALGQPWTAMWLIFWVIINVTTAFYSLDLSPRFYYWGYAWPLHNIVEASHQLLFDLHSRIGLNFGILFAWVAINTVLFPFACYLMRWKGQREQRLKAEKEKRWLQAMPGSSSASIISKHRSAGR